MAAEAGAEGRGRHRRRLSGLLAGALAADPPDAGIPSLLLVLTALSGMIDAVSVLHFHKVFVANMTGNLVFVGLGLARAPGFGVAPSAVALAGFAAGGILCRTVLAGDREGRALIRRAVGCEALLLAAATAVAAATGRMPGEGVRDTLIAVCAVALGVQNAMAGRVGAPGLTTTVMTRTLVGLIDNLGDPARSRATTRQGLSVAVLLAGAVAGGVLVDRLSPAAALAATTALATTVAAAAARPRPPGPGNPHTPPPPAPADGDR